MKNLILVLSIFFAACASPPKDVPSELLKDFIDQFNASPGWGGLPSGSDFSAVDFGKTLNSTRDQLTTLSAIDTSKLSFTVGNNSEIRNQN